MQSLRIDFESISTMARALYESQTMEGAPSGLHRSTILEVEDHNGEIDVGVAGDSIGNCD